MVLTGNGELGFDSGEGALKTATTSKEWDSHCPYLSSSEPTAKGTGLGVSAGKEDPVEFDSSLVL